MKIYHRPELDYLSIDFSDKPEAKSYFENGVIVRQDRRGNVIGIDITDSHRFFGGADFLTLQQASRLVKLSESTLRRKIKAGLIKARKPNGKDYRISRAELLKLVA